MTTDQFNEKYKDYLEEGHYGLAISDPAIITYLDGVFQGLIKIPGFKYSQVKEKFSTCRFYTNLHSILGKADYISSNVERTINSFLDYSDYAKKRGS